MIAYQVPTVMRHLKPSQIFDEGATSFLVVGIFAFLASVGTPVTSNMLNDLSLTELEGEISDALAELEQLQLIEPVQIADAGDIDGMLAELSEEVSA